MEIGGSSRLVSDSEHLISSALDQSSQRPGLYGPQVGMATYLTAHRQAQRVHDVGKVIDQTGFIEGIRSDPFSCAEWLEAVHIVTSIKPGFYTILSERNCTQESEPLIDADPLIHGCFVAQCGPILAVKIRRAVYVAR